MRGGYYERGGGCAGRGGDYGVLGCVFGLVRECVGGFVSVGGFSCERGGGGCGQWGSFFVGVGGLVGVGGGGCAGRGVGGGVLGCVYDFCYGSERGGCCGGSGRGERGSFFYYECGGVRRGDYERGGGCAGRGGGSGVPGCVFGLVRECVGGFVSVGGFSCERGGGGCGQWGSFFVGVGGLVGVGGRGCAGRGAGGGVFGCVYDFCYGSERGGCCGGSGRGERG